MKTHKLVGFLFILLIGVVALTQPKSVHAATETLRPSAAGDETAITSQYPASTSHYDKVDEASTDDLTTYVYNTGQSTYQRDLYALQDHSVGSGTINSVAVYGRFYWAGAATPNQNWGKVAVKSGSTVTEYEFTYSTTMPAITTWYTVSNTWTTNPTTSQAWTWTEIDALQAGISIRRAVSTGVANADCTQVYVVVDYTVTKANGEACTVGTECASGNCVDLTCCDTTCTGSLCQRCDSTYVTTGGTCSNVKSATDPDSDCGALDCDGGATKYYSGWSSNVCYYKADVSAADAVCTGTSLACKTAADMCPSSTQGASSGVTATACQTQLGCTGTTVGTTGNVTADTDPNVGCAGYGCTSKVYGWSGNDCKAAAATSHDGMCNGSGACYTTFADSCTTGSTLASCGESACKNASACVQDSASTTSDTAGEVCYTSGQHGCPTGQACDSTGTCVVPDCTTIPTSGDYTVATGVGNGCAFPVTNLVNGKRYHGLDAGTGTENTARLIIGTVGTPGYLTVLYDQVLAVGKIELVNGSVTIIKDENGGGVIKLGSPIYILDGDGDGYPDCSSTTTQYVTGTTNLARRGATCDGNDAVACTSGTNPAGDCNKCVDGVTAYQSGSDDFDECAVVTPGCSTTCVKTGSDGNCNGAGACNAGGNVTAGKVCSAGSEVDATTQALACDTNTNYNCTAGSCTGNYRYSECNSNGTCDTAATTNYQETAVTATSGNTLTATCTSSTAAVCVTRTACKDKTYCDGNGSCNTPANIAAGDDTWSDCGAVTCTGYYHGWEGDVCYNSANVTAANAKCDGAGACRTTAVECAASHGTAYLTRTDCKTEIGCTGTTAGSMGNVANLSDTYDDCDLRDCSLYAWGWYNTRYCVAAMTVSANNGYCNGSGACYPFNQACQINSSDVIQSCGSAACVYDDACVQGEPRSAYTAKEWICLVDHESCGTDKWCNSTGTCVSCVAIGGSCASDSVCCSAWCGTDGKCHDRP